MAPSTVSANVQDVLALLAPDVQVPASCERQNNIMRGEVTLAGEAMAALKFAKSKRVLFVGWDESAKFGNAVFSCNFMVEQHDGTREDVYLRGLSILPEGGTSKAVLAHIERRILSYARRMLELWKSHTSGCRVRAAGRQRAGRRLRTLASTAFLRGHRAHDRHMQRGSLCMKRLLADSIMESIKEKVGASAWETQ